MSYHGIIYFRIIIKKCNWEYIDNLKPVRNFHDNDKNSGEILVIFDKKELGRAEIATRGQAIQAHLATLLLMVGKIVDNKLLKKVAGLLFGQEHRDQFPQLEADVSFLQRYVQ